MGGDRSGLKQQLDQASRTSQAAASQRIQFLTEGKFACNLVGQSCEGSVCSGGEERRVFHVREQCQDSMCRN